MISRGGRQRRKRTGRGGKKGKRDLGSNSLVGRIREHSEFMFSTGVALLFSKSLLFVCVAAGSLRLASKSGRPGIADEGRTFLLEMDVTTTLTACSIQWTHLHKAVVGVDLRVQIAQKKGSPSLSSQPPRFGGGRQEPGGLSGRIQEQKREQKEEQSKSNSLVPGCTRAHGPRAPAGG